MHLFNSNRSSLCHGVPLYMYIITMYMYIVHCTSSSSSSPNSNSAHFLFSLSSQSRRRPLLPFTLKNRNLNFFPFDTFIETRTTKVYHRSWSSCGGTIQEATLYKVMVESPDTPSPHPFLSRIEYLTFSSQKFKTKIPSYKLSSQKFDFIQSDRIKNLT